MSSKMTRFGTAAAALCLTGAVAAGGSLTAGGAEAKPKALADAIKGHGLAAGDHLYSPPGAQKVKDVDVEDQSSDKAGGTPQGEALPKTKATKQEALAKARSEVVVRTAGCVLEYGAGDGCLPVASPGQVEHDRQMGHMPGMVVSWTCPQVRELFPGGIQLTQAGVDPQGLDGNADGVGCGAGD